MTRCRRGVRRFAREIDSWSEVLVLHKRVWGGVEGWESRIREAIFRDYRGRNDKLCEVHSGAESGDLESCLGFPMVGRRRFGNEGIGVRCMQCWRVGLRGYVQELGSLHSV